MKKIYFILASFIFCNNFNKDLISIKDKITPENSVFVFDMHGVLLDFDFDSAMSAFNSHTNKLKLVYRLGGFGLNRLFKYSKPDFCIEHAVIKDSDSYQFKVFTLPIINPHKPNFDSIDLIKDIHSKGFKIFGCSNIGEQSLDYLRLKFVLLRDFFDKCFSGFQLPSKKNNFITKKDARFYIDCKKMIDSKLGHSPQYIFFIDDSLDKISVAENTCGEFWGIHFKSATDLRSILNLKNII